MEVSVGDIIVAVIVYVSLNYIYDLWKTTEVKNLNIVKREKEKQIKRNWFLEYLFGKNR
ncbi:p7 protein [Blueberry virus A]|uniref:p7 protein n=1 Tax=Blueberry virus A TaxID=1206566 RepID=J7M628_9CLOS|nr:p7 protein [Blueberry virus A]AGU69235.1 p7 protein [Blueberry virus A]QYU71612.1 p7 protein [Blueberry virus A]BAM37098.1 p7 protein [Blueberry virus A]